MTGTLQIKNDTYYAVINVYENGKRKQKWINSKLSVKGNKTRAEKFLREQITLFEKKHGIAQSEILFSEYVQIWLEHIRKKVDDITFQGYEQIAKSQIIPYFDCTAIRLQELTSTHLQRYVDEKSRCGRIDKKGGLSARSIKLHRNVINQTLKYAIKNGLIEKNPCTFIDLPSVKRHEPTFYTSEQIENLLDTIRNDRLYLLIKVTAFYGLRRSEVLGLQWESVDFDNNTLKIAHTVVKVNEVVRKDKTKNMSSYRTFPLIGDIKKLLLDERETQKRNRSEFKKMYIDSPYIFVWDDGKPFNPEYVSQHFRKLLKWNELPHIRFHDLRHSCASILLSQGFTLKDVQEWLGHADITMTANVYGHLDMERKKSIAEAMEKAII